MILKYEPLIPEHAQALFPVLADPAVYRYIDDDIPPSVEELSKRFKQMSSGPPENRTDELWWNYVVQLVEPSLPIGRLQATIIQDRAEVAYLFGPAYWGRGYATEAMQWLHRQLQARTSASTFWATARPENLRSIKLLRRLGYARVREWPRLVSYDSGDVVYRRSASVA
jgi:RimJ/RimL family protein N-acetyltransferase